MRNESYKARLLRVQWLINIKMAKAYRTVSNEALCLLTGMMPIGIKIEEAQLYQLTRGTANDKTRFDKDMRVRHCQHPAEASISITDEKEENGSMHIYTDGSKTEKGFGSGIAFFESERHTKSLQRRLNKSAQITEQRN